jgi:hypothetical protein
MANINGGRVVVTLEGKDVSLSSIIARVTKEMEVAGNTVSRYDTKIAQLSRSKARANTQAASYAQTLAKVASAAGNDSEAVLILSRALQQLQPNTLAANRVLLQLQQTLNSQAIAAQRAAAATERANLKMMAAQKAEAAAMRDKLSGLTKLGGAFNGLIGAYFAVGQAATLFAKTMAAGNDLERTEATFRTLSGDAENYAKNLASAKNQQKLFGGSLRENMEGLAGFANLARRTGIEIDELANMARAMAIIDPLQGFEGASIALKEFDNNVMM